MCSFSTPSRCLEWFASRSLALLLTLALLMFASSAAAHTIGISTGEYVARGSSVVGKLAFARAEIAALAPGVDANRDGHLTASEIASASGVLRDRVLARIVVSAKGEACAPVLTDAALTELDGLLVSARWECKSFDAPFEIEFALVEELGRGHKHVARTRTESGTHDEVLSAEARKVVVAAEVVEKTPGTGPGTGTGRVGAFLWMGVSHISSGADHLVFLAGLLLVRARVRSLVAVVTAFTVAHSITLAIATLGVWTPRSTIIEPAIGLTIAYVGIENFVVRDATKRWRITFPFGLVHGFGFASALRELALDRAALPTALLSFNIGVELGQLGVLALVVPIVQRLHGQAWFERWGRRAASAGIVIAGLVWFIARLRDR